MKQIISIALLVAGLNLSAQSLGGVKFSEIENTYLEVSIRTTLTLKMAVTIDAGQRYELFKVKKNFLTDEEGKKVAFKSAVDILEFFHKAGFELVSENFTSNGTVTTRNFLLKREPWKAVK